nr:terminase [Piscirickettsiaceae bacterium]
MKHPNVLNHISNGHNAVIDAFAKGLEPPERLAIQEWADSRRRLPSKGSSEPGKWRTSRTPFLAEIMECLDPYHPCHEVSFMKSSQVGGTEILLNWVGWFVDTQRSSMMVVQPTLDLAEKWSKQRFAPMIEECPSLREKIPPARSRDSGNTTLMKEWPGGLIAISGSNSAASLAMMPIQNLGFDEMDRYPVELDGEGDPVKIAEARTTTYPNYKIFKISSPTIESLSRINKEYLRSDQRKYLVPCPHCGHEHELVFENLIYQEGETENAQMACPDCGALFDETNKTEMLAAGHWKVTNPEGDHPGFHISGLYAPIGLGKTWAALAKEYEEVKHDPTRLKVFKNTRLGITEKDKNEKLDWQEIQQRGEDYLLKTLPENIYVVTVGIDVQKDRFAVQALGWGPKGKHAIVDQVELPGDPTKEEDWDVIIDYMLAGFTAANGMAVSPLGMLVDSGNWQNEVLNFVKRAKRKLRGMLVMAGKGASQKFKPIITKPSKVEFTWRGKTIKNGAEQWQVGHDTAKMEIFNRLNSDKEAKYPTDQHIRFSKHLSEYYYVQLTAEIYDPHKRKFIKTHERNEALDTFVYAIAVGHHPNLRINNWNERQWARLETKYTQRGLFDAPEPPAKEVKADVPEKNNPPEQTEKQQENKATKPKPKTKKAKKPAAIATAYLA